MTLALRWSNAARRDLLEIWRWRGRDYPEVGDRALDRIEAAYARLTRFPHLGPPLSRIALDARKLTIDGYLALYRVDVDVVVIVRIVDQRQLLEAATFDEQ